MDLSLNLFAKGALLFSDTVILAPLLIIGFISRGGFFIIAPSKEETLIWGNAALLVLFTMIFNTFLKSLFLIPLDPALGLTGFAFPSGHMNVSTVFYGWLLLNYPHQILRFLLSMIICAIGFSLIQQGYHTLGDVMGALGFGILILYSFIKMTRRHAIKRNPPIMGFYMASLAGLMLGIIELRIGVTAYMIKTFMGLISFTLIWIVLKRTGFKV